MAPCSIAPRSASWASSRPRSPNISSQTDPEPALLSLDWPALDLAADVKLVIGSEMPALNPATEAAVAQAWANAKARRPDLFNGRVFSVDTISPRRITGHWTEYRRIIAQMADHALFPTLKARSLAVCGVLSGPDGVAVARREPRSSYLASLWQLPPAGSVDHSASCPGGASWQHAILAELREELGIHPADIGPMRPLCAVQHPSGVLDMGILIPTTLTAPQLLERHRAQGDAEYDQLQIHPANALIAAIEAQGGTLVPTARRFLRCLGHPA